MPDVIVAGGGVIGLSIAHAVATEGKSVLVLNSGDATDAASWAAAGMLAPQSEADRRDPLFDLCAASLRMYRGWACQLKEQSGIDPEYETPGLLYVASSEQSLEVLKGRMSWQRTAGFESELVSPDELRRMEPMLTLPVVGGVHMPGEHHVTPRLLLEALRRACISRGVEIRNGQRVREVLKAGNRVSGVRVDSDTISAGCVVVASGVRSKEIQSLCPALPIFPRKGQVLSLNTPASVFRKLIRWEHAYAVQRRGGELVVGATNEDAGFDRTLTPSGIGWLLDRIQKLSSHTAAFAIKEMWTGLRPATPDGLPVLGHAGLSGLIYATGHYRNGVLLAPITAAIVAALVENRTPPVNLDAYAPGRFAV
ncbi:MAG TPA: glycine oxidase ThiO [Terriglobia bacterium]|nr:glycine oxidase ThiO [Terriglobia bacterium]